MRVIGMMWNFHIEPAHGLLHVTKCGVRWIFDRWVVGKNDDLDHSRLEMCAKVTSR